MVRWMLMVISEHFANNSQFTFSSSAHSPDPPQDREAASFYRSVLALAKHKVEITRINAQSHSLADGEDRIANVERIDEQQHPAADREEPERQRDHAAPDPFGRHPLHDEPHGEQGLPGIADEEPPVELHEEDVLQVIADRLRQTNQHLEAPPKYAARVFCAGSATTRPQDRQYRSTAGPTFHNGTRHGGAADRPHPHSPRHSRRAGPAPAGTGAGHRNRVAPGTRRAETPSTRSRCRGYRRAEPCCGRRWRYATAAA